MTDNNSSNNNMSIEDGYSHVNDNSSKIVAHNGNTKHRSRGVMRAYGLTNTPDNNNKKKTNIIRRVIMLSRLLTVLMR